MALYLTFSTLGLATFHDMSFFVMSKYKYMSLHETKKEGSDNKTFKELKIQQVFQALGTKL